MTARIDLERDPPDSAALALVPIELAVRWEVLPWRIVDDALVFVAVEEPTAEVLGDLEFLAQRPVRWVRADAGSLRRSIARFAQEPPPQISPPPEPSPVNRLVGTIFARAAEHRADEVVVDPGDAGVVVTWRRGGTVVESLTVPSLLRPGLTAKLKKLAGLDVAERRRPQRGEVELATEPPARYVIAAIPVQGGEQIVIARLGGQP